MMEKHITEFLKKIAHVNEQQVLQTFLCELRGQNSYNRFLGKPEKILFESNDPNESNNLTELLCKMSCEINKGSNKTFNKTFNKTLQKEAFHELLHTVLTYYCFDEKYATLIEIGKTMRRQNYPKSAIIQILKENKQRIQQHDIHKVMCKIYEGTTWPDNSWEI